MWYYSNRFKPAVTDHYIVADTVAKDRACMYYDAIEQNWYTDHYKSKKLTESPELWTCLPTFESVLKEVDAIPKIWEGDTVKSVNPLNPTTYVVTTINDSGTDIFVEPINGSEGFWGNRDAYILIEEEK